MEMIPSQDAIDRFLSFIAANGGSPNTIRAYRTDLRMTMEWLQANHPSQMKAKTYYPTGWLEMALGEYLNEVRKTAKATTVKRKLATLKSWGKWAGHSNFLSSYRPPTPLPPTAHPIPEGIGGVQRMLSCAGRATHQALIGLQGLCGLRVSEALACEAEWFTFETDGIWLTVRGKGDKQRRVPVSMDAWMAIAPAWSTAMTVSDRRLVPLTDRAARRAITRIAARAGLDKDTASHDLRATFATAAYDESGADGEKKDIRVVQELMGHANSSTTEIYIGTTDASMRSAVDFTKSEEN